jgi:hypothetical protein
MRMWGVDPVVMCNQHLLGEHFEMHMFVGHLQSGKRLGKFADGLCDPALIESRHSKLVMEMLRRGMNHNTPLTFTWEGESGYVASDSYAELMRRCFRCRERESCVMQ